MQIQARFRDGIARGDVTLTFRRWKRCQVLPGHRYRTAAGRIEVDAVDVVDPARISDRGRAALRFRVAAELLAELRGDDTLPTYRIRFHMFDRTRRARRARGVGRLVRRRTRPSSTARLAVSMPQLARSRGPSAVLRTIETQPGVRAADLAAQFGRETQPFKLDVRKLKNLGLTDQPRDGLPPLPERPVLPLPEASVRYRISSSLAHHPVAARRGGGRGSIRRRGRA